MASQVTLMTNYKTIPYREKVEKEQEAAIEKLLEILPPYVTDYSNHKTTHVVIKTRREYLQDIYSFFRFLHEEIDAVKDIDIRDIPVDVLSTLTLDDFSDYDNWLANKDTGAGKNSKTTIKRKKSSLRSFFTYLYASDRISVNPVAKIVPTRGKRTDRTKIRVLSDKERQVFLAEFDIKYDEAVQKLNDAIAISESKGKPVPEAVRMKPAIVKRDKAIVYLFLGTGLRVSELCAINVRNFARKTEYINVIRKGEDPDNNNEVTDQVLLGKEVMQVLVDYIDNFRDIIGPDSENYDALFISSKHKRITPRAVEQMVKAYADDTLGEDHGVHPHVLRASFGSRYQDTYGDILSTSEVMNHASVEVTARHYLHQNTNSKEAAKKLPVL